MWFQLDDRLDESKIEISLGMSDGMMDNSELKWQLGNSDVVSIR